MTYIEEQAEDLRNWMYDTDEYEIDAVLEFLHDESMLTEEGEELYHEFWERYIRDD